MNRVLNIFILVCTFTNSFGQENLLSFFDSDEDMVNFLTLLKHQQRSLI